MIQKFEDYGNDKDFLKINGPNKAGEGVTIESYYKDSYPLSMPVLFDDPAKVREIADFLNKCADKMEGKENE